MTRGRKPAATAQAKIEILAPLEVIWRIQTDIDRWSEWNPKIDHARLEGPLAVGSTFKWKSGGASIVSRIQDLEPMRRLVWTGKAMGAYAHHAWDFERRDDLVLITTEESFEGWWPRLFPGPTRKMLQGILQTWLAHLKQASETEIRK